MNAVPRLAGPGDLALLLAGLRALAQDLGDPFRIPPAALAQALFAPHPPALGLVAGEAPLGVALVQPVVSTSMGGMFGHVSDLWVAPAARGQGLGRALLALAWRAAQDRWQAVALRLGVDAANPQALAFYTRLGFSPRPSERVMVLHGPALDHLTGACP